MAKKKKKKKSQAMMGGGTAAAALAGILGLHFLEKHIGAPVRFTSKNSPNYAPPPEGGYPGMGIGTWGHGPNVPSMFSPGGRPKTYWDR